MLAKPADGRPLTARDILDFLCKHSVNLNQGYYPLQFWIEDSTRNYLETFYKEENLRFLPEDLQSKRVVNLATLDNRELIYVMQLCVRPTSRDKYLEQLRVCVSMSRHRELRMGSPIRASTTTITWPCSTW